MHKLEKTDLLLLKQRAAQAFTAGINKPIPPSGCWVWKNYTQKGRPVMRAYGKRVYAHRFILEYKSGEPLPAYCMIKRTCGNNLCVNPDHLIY